MKKKTTVISGFPGVGKSWLFENNQDKAILDSDSSNFSWENQKKRIRHSEWPKNYISHIQKHLGDADVILVSSHEEVRNALVEANIDFSLVYPGINMKDEYIQRYRDRGNADKFVELLEANYETWISDLGNQKECEHIVLDSGQYLSDVIEI